MYRDHIDVHLDASKEIILEEYKKIYKLKEMPRACVTRPLAEATSATPPSAHPDTSENFGERTRSLLNKRAAASASTNYNRMVVAKNRPAEAELPPQANTFVDAAIYIKLKATLEVIFVLGRGVFLQQY